MEQDDDTKGLVALLVAIVGVGLVVGLFILLIIGVVYFRFPWGT